MKMKEMKEEIEGMNVEEEIDARLKILKVNMLIFLEFQSLKVIQLIIFSNLWMLQSLEFLS